MRIYVKTTILLMFVALLSACGTKTSAEVFYDTHPNAEILQEIKIQEGLVILYSENQNVGAAKLSDDSKGWKFVSSNSTGGDEAIIYGLVNKEEDDEILFGRINETEITEVQLRTESGKDIDATVIESPEDTTFWYLEWKYENAELIGLSKDGTILYRTTFRKQ